MATNGSNNNLDAKLLLTTALKAYESAEIRSQDRKAYSKMLNQFSKLITQAIADKDIPTLFALEKGAQEFDYAIAQGKDKRRDSINVLGDLQDHWTRCQDADFVKNKFDRDHSGIGKATSPIKDGTMTNGIISQCRKISSIAGAKRVPAEDLFYSKRQEGLRLIDKEHNKIINQHLGLSKGKEMSR